MFTRSHLAKFVADGWISETKHPEFNLWIYNYSKSCQFERHWVPETIGCRGLVLDIDSNVIARGFDKFFNAEEHARSDLLFGKPFSVTEKVDGSLGIYYEVDDVGNIATRGSFSSDQAIEATRILHTKYEYWRGPKGATPLFEIVFPANRIVIDYGKMEDLVLLAVINNETGVDEPLEIASWPGPCVQEYPAIGLKPHEVLATLGVDDGQHEGFVLRFNFEGKTPRMKVKLEEYKRLHRILTGVSSKTIWEALRTNSSLDEVLKRVPDEFFKWVQREIAGQTDAHHSLIARTNGAFLSVKDKLPANFSRKEFAEKAFNLGETFNDVEPGWLFMLLDGQNIDEKVWRRLKPQWTTPFRSDDGDGEDA